MAPRCAQINKSNNKRCSKKPLEGGIYCSTHKPKDENNDTEQQSDKYGDVDGDGHDHDNPKIEERTPVIESTSNSVVQNDDPPPNHTAMVIDDDISNQTKNSILEKQHSIDSDYTVNLEKQVQDLSTELNALRDLLGKMKISKPKSTKTLEGKILAKAKSLFYYAYKDHPDVIVELAKRNIKMVETKKKGHVGPYYMYKWQDVRILTNEAFTNNQQIRDEYILKAKTLIELGIRVFSN